MTTLILAINGQDVFFGFGIGVLFLAGLGHVVKAVRR